MQQQNKLKIIFFGTTEFAVPVLEALFKNDYGIAMVITTPDKPAGRKQIPTPPPIKIVAEKLNLKILQPQTLKTRTPEIENFDMGIVASYGKIIPKEVIDSFPLGIIGVHPSLLPKYRGPSPIQTAILNGDEETGITIFKIDEEVDHGPILTSQRSEIKNKNYEELHDNELAKLGAELLIKILPDYLANKITPVPQNHNEATFTRKFQTEDGEITMNDTAANAYNKIRALNPEPGTFIFVKDKRLKILEASLSPQRNDVHAGLFNLDGQLGLQLKDGLLVLTKVQLEGKKPISGKEFIGGYANIFL